MTTVLLIEDNNSNATILQDMFAFDGIPARLVTVKSGREGLRRAEELQPALILMDLRLPDIDGLETTRLLKSCTLTKTIPIWAVTAYAMDGDKQRALAAGCSEYITKPIKVAELAGRIRDFLKEHQHHKKKVLECNSKHTS